jgi:hypothetical protein
MTCGVHSEPCPETPPGRIGIGIAVAIGFARSVRRRSPIAIPIRYRPSSNAKGGTGNLLSRIPMFDAAAHHASHGRKRAENPERKLFSVLRVPVFRGYKEAQIEPQVHLLNRNNPVEGNARKQSNFGIEVYPKIKCGWMRIHWAGCSTGELNVWTRFARAISSPDSLINRYCSDVQLVVRRFRSMPCTSFFPSPSEMTIAGISARRLRIGITLLRK